MTRSFFILMVCATTIFAPINAQDDLKVTYFFKALEDENYERINQYLESGVSINHERIVKERDKVDRTTHQGPVPYHVSEDSRTPLLRAIELKKPELIRFLVENGANVNQSLSVVSYVRCQDCPLDRYGKRPYRRISNVLKPISWAISWGDIGMIDFLINKGADFSYENERIKRTGNQTLIEYFENKGMEFEFVAADIHFLYTVAFSEGRKEFVRSLIEDGVEVTRKTIYKMVEQKDTLSLRVTFDNGADVNGFYVKESLRMCPLCQATIMCDYNLIKWLVEEYDADPNLVCDFIMVRDKTLYNLSSLQIATNEFVGKCRGRNDAVIEYFLLRE